MNTHFPATLAMHLADGVHAARRRYRRRLARCQERFSESAVHELRVETRRVLAMLDLIETLRLGDSLKKTRKVFKRRLDAFDDLRDTQVQLGLLKPMARRFPQAQEFGEQLRRRQRRLTSLLRDRIKSAKSTRLNRRLKEIERHLRDCAGAGSGEPGGAPAAAALEAIYARVTALRQLVRRRDSRTLHRLRVAFKRFRYMSELLQPFFPRLTPERLERMRNYQVMAGDIQDLEVLLARLAQAVGNGELKPAETRNLRSELLRRRRRAIDSFMARIDDLFEFRP